MLNIDVWGIHGDDAIKVFKELNEAVKEVIKIFQADGIPLPTPKGVEMFEAV